MRDVRNSEGFLLSKGLVVCSDRYMGTGANSEKKNRR